MLFCLSHAGGVATTVYRSWQAELAPEHEVVPLDYAGRGVRSHEAPDSSPEAVVEDVARCVARQVPPGDPWAVFGHSMGAMVAYRVAARACHDPALTAPQVVLVSGRRPPGDRPVRPLGATSVDDLLADAVAWGGIPPEVGARPHLARPLLRRLVDDLRLSHDPPGHAPVLTCPLHVLWSDDDPLTRTDRIGRWVQASNGYVGFHRFAGDHFFLGDGARLAIPLVREVLRQTAPDRRPVAAV
ncbi:thioesterase [Cellulomonas chitinilytica]|uniref:Thioesterase n=1 Tax=Cellulomonas chitinilytica TaxID=398759 RepID=A0A919U2Q2_9CELL|nr:alpha/beta fold hydrolase [Cellulomonas chitinilytica]GIG21697.1 thioesterase [Cellulomonas chitinilytica]